MMYSDKVWDHFSNPRNVGEIADADGVGEVGNATCGDIMKIYLKIDHDVITDVKFKTFGCGAAIATSSMATEMVKGKRVAEALQLTNKAVAEALDGLPPVKMHCSMLAEQAIHAAVEDYIKKHPEEAAGLELTKAEYMRLVNTAKQKGNERLNLVMSRVMRKIDFGIWQKSITGGGLTALWLLFSRQGAKGQGRRYAARLALDAL